MRNTSRRKFLSELGLTLLSAPLLSAQEGTRRHTRREMLSNNEPIDVPIFKPDRIGLNVATLLTIGTKRLVYPALEFEEIGPIDLILVSHGHMDHLDTPTLRRFNRSTPIVMAKNNVDLIDAIGYESVHEIDWGQWSQIGAVRVEALEVKHFGWQYRIPEELQETRTARHPNRFRHDAHWRV